MYWTKVNLKKFFFEEYGWLVVLGAIIFSIRGSTLWNSRVKDSVPAVDQILILSSQILLVLVLFLMVVILIRLGLLFLKNRKIGFPIREYEIADILSSSLSHCLAGYIILGLLFAWALDLPIFGGFLGSALTLVQIIAGVLPILAHSSK